MEQTSFTSVIIDQTQRALWEVKNLIRCVPDSLWGKSYCQMPLWKHIYHMLHSLDLWMINPRDPAFEEPPVHEKDLNNLDIPPARQLTRPEIESYYEAVSKKVTAYLRSLRDSKLLSRPEGCEYARFTLILAQHRHLHTHLGMLMGFLVADLGRWPLVVGLEGKIPSDENPHWF